MTILSQRDPRWGDTQIGNSKTYIKDYGCTLTCIAMILGTTPDVVNARLTAVGGFAEGNLIIWAKIAEAFPDVVVKRVWTYENSDVKANVPNVLVEVPAAPIGGTGKHWVVFIGNGRLYDPWTGTSRPTSDFPNPSGYCVVTKPVPAPVVNPCQEKDDRIQQLDVQIDQLTKQNEDLNNKLLLANTALQQQPAIYTPSNPIAKALYSLALQLDGKS